MYPISNGHARDAAPGSTTRLDGSTPGGVPGQWLVLGLVLTLLLVWGCLFFFFRSWRERYVALSTFGKTQVAPLVDQLEPLIPTGVSRDAWLSRLSDTRAVLVATTSAGMMSQDQMTALQSEIQLQVGSATSANAAQVVDSLWESLEQKAGSVIHDFHERQEFGKTQVAPLVDTLLDLTPKGTPPEEWKAAVGRARQFIEVLCSAEYHGMRGLQTLQKTLRERVDQVSERPETAQAILVGIWDLLENESSRARSNRKDWPQRPPLLDQAPSAR